MVPGISGELKLAHTSGAPARPLSAATVAYAAADAALLFALHRLLRRRPMFVADPAGVAAEVALASREYETLAFRTPAALRRHNLLPHMLLPSLQPGRIPGRFCEWCRREVADSVGRPCFVCRVLLKRIDKRAAAASAPDSASVAA